MDYTITFEHITPDGWDVTVLLPTGYCWTLHADGQKPQDSDAWILENLEKLYAVGILPTEEL